MITDIDSIGIVTPVAFKEMLATGNVESASIQVSEKGLIIVLQLGASTRILGRSRGGARCFHSVDGAASVLLQHGIYQFNVDVEGWLPRTLTRNKGRSSLGKASDDL